MSNGLFSPITFGAITAPNRIFMAPLTRCRAPERVPTDLMLEYYVQRASAGLIISEATQISAQGVGYPATPGIHSVEQIAGWKRITDAVHSAGGRMFLQLWHTGRANFVWQAGDDLPVSPSGVPMNSSPAKSRALPIEEIPAIVDAYASGAENALAAGFDGVELHGANGYLLDQFTRDGTNIRADAYGGSIDNRLRFPLEVARKVIAAVGADRTGYRISPSSTFNEMRDSNPRDTFGALSRELSKLGLAYLHVVEQNAKDVKHGGEDEVAASYFRDTFKQTIIANGGYTLDRAETTLASGDADAITFGTAFLANPDLPERFRQRETLNDAVPATFYTGGERGYTDYPALVSAR